MNSMEDRLRAAYQEAAQTIAPQTVRHHSEQTIQISTANSRWDRVESRRVVVPLAAAASVAIAVVLAAVVIPRALSASHPTTQPLHHRQNNSATIPGDSLAPRFVIATPSNSSSHIPLVVHSAATGAVVARVRAPQPGMYFDDLATGDGRTYVAVLFRFGGCRSWLYQFRLNGAGHPSALIPYRLPSTAEGLESIAVSKDNGTFAYVGQKCTNPTGVGPSDLAVMNVATKRTRRWTIPSQTDVTSLSLTATGSVLAYAVFRNRPFSNMALVLPTNALPGNAIERSRVIVRARQFRAEEINRDVITPDGRELYFTTIGDSASGGTNTQLRVASVATGRSRILQKISDWAYDPAANPAVSKMLVLIQPSTAPSPTPTPSPSGRSTAKPSPSASPSQPYDALLAMIDLSTGKITFLDTSIWQIPAGSSFAW